jgi:hypothetical protein
MDVATRATTRSDVVHVDDANRAALLRTCRHQGWFLMPRADASCSCRAAVEAARRRSSCAASFAATARDNRDSASEIDAS